MCIFPKAPSLSFCSSSSWGWSGVGEELIIKVYITTFMLKTPTSWAINHPLLQISVSKRNANWAFPPGHLTLTWMIGYPSHLIDCALNFWAKASGSTNSIWHPAWNAWNLGVLQTFYKHPLQMKAWLWLVSSQVFLEIFCHDFIPLHFHWPTKGLDCITRLLNSFCIILSFNQLKFIEENYGWGDTKMNKAHRQLYLKSENGK